MAHARIVLVFGMALMVASCGLFTSKATRALRKSPDYRAGYQDGCNSGYGPDANKRRDDTTVRDDEAYQNNKAYREGWNRGNTACRPSSYSGASPASAPNAGPIPDMNPGNGGLPPPR